MPRLMHGHAQVIQVPADAAGVRAGRQVQDSQRSGVAHLFLNIIPGPLLLAGVGKYHRRLFRCINGRGGFGHYAQLCSMF
jgi:hypothetical protein